VTLVQQVDAELLGAHQENLGIASEGERDPLSFVLFGCILELFNFNNNVKKLLCEIISKEVKIEAETTL
jgi:hypothetical protein